MKKTSYTEMQRFAKAGACGDAYPSSFAGSDFLGHRRGVMGGVLSAVHRQRYDRAVGSGVSGLDVLRHDLAAAVAGELNVQVGGLEHLLGKGAGLADDVGALWSSSSGRWPCTGKWWSRGHHAAADGVLVDDIAAAGADQLMLEAQAVQRDLRVRPGVVQAGLHGHSAGGVVVSVLLDAQIGRDLADDVADNGSHDLAGIVLDPARVIQQDENLDLGISMGSTAAKLIIL